MKKRFFKKFFHKYVFPIVAIIFVSFAIISTVIILMVRDVLTNSTEKDIKRMAGVGTNVLLLELGTDIESEELGAVQPRDASHCIHCGACKRACPTGILSGDGCDCLSAITQKKGELSEGEAELMRKFNTVWGCDECQKACPYNKSPNITPIEFFRRDRIPKLTSEILNGMSKEEFTKRAFAWRGRKTVERNLELLDY